MSCHFRAAVLFTLFAVLCSGCGSDSNDVENTDPINSDPGGQVAISQTKNLEPTTAPDNQTDQASASSLVDSNTTPPTSTVATHPKGKQSKGGMAMGSMGAMKMPAPADMKFNDTVESNVQEPQGLDGLLFVDTDNKRVQLSDYLHKKHVVLVFTEGFSGMLCPFCKTQTSRLVANYEEFQKLNAEILVVYPGERDHLQEFIDAARTVDRKQLAAVPFPVVLDQKLEAVDHFEIRSKLAHPSTYVIDKQGKVQLAYVGKDMSADRPSIKALLETFQSPGRQNAGHGRLAQCPQRERFDPGGRPATGDGHDPVRPHRTDTGL